MTPMKSLDQQSVLITGCATGIGAAIAEAAARQGARLILADVQAERIAQLAGRLDAEAHTMDVADPDAWDALATATPPWDAVFLNAGIMSAPAEAPAEASNFLTLDLERYRRVLSVNVDGVAFGLRTAIPRMRERGGSIVATASASGLIGWPFDPLYAMTKHAVVGLVRSMALTLAPPGEPSALRLSAICPGGVGTDLVPSALREHMGSLMTPEVLAAEAVDLCLNGSNGEIRAKVTADHPAEAVAQPRIFPGGPG